PWPAALDEPDAQGIEVAGDGELVGHRVRDPLALGAVAQRGVEDVEGVAEGSFGGFGAGHRSSLCGRKGLSGKQKDLPRMREVCASAVERLADALLDNDHAGARHGAEHGTARPAVSNRGPHRGTSWSPIGPSSKVRAVRAVEPAASGGIACTSSRRSTTT